VCVCVCVRERRRGKATNARSRAFTCARASYSIRTRIEHTDFHFGFSTNSSIPRSDRERDARSSRVEIMRNLESAQEHINRSSTSRYSRASYFERSVPRRNAFPKIRDEDRDETSRTSSSWLSGGDDENRVHMLRRDACIGVMRYRPQPVRGVSLIFPAGIPRRSRAINSVTKRVRGLSRLNTRRLSTHRCGVFIGLNDDTNDDSSVRISAASERASRGKCLSAIINSFVKNACMRSTGASKIPHDDRVRPPNLSFSEFFCVANAVIGS